MNAEDPIGIFDSGIGGLTVAHAINTSLPNEKLIYFGDTQHLPYGDKSIEKINTYSCKIANFLSNKNCKAIIIACNSASSVAFQKIKYNLQNKCLIFNVIDPVINEVINDYSIKKIGVIGTNATINSNVYETKIGSIRKDIQIISKATPLLANLIEENNKELYKKGIIESYLLDESLEKIDSLILGCTHYPLIEGQINNFYKKQVKLISSIKNIGKIVKSSLGKNNLLNMNKKLKKHEFYVSDYTQIFQQKTQLFFPSSIILEEQNIFS